MTGASGASSSMRAAIPPPSPTPRPEGGSEARGAGDGARCADLGFDAGLARGRRSKSGTSGAGSVPPTSGADFSEESSVPTSETYPPG
jgi:hypothetical protein